MIELYRHYDANGVLLYVGISLSAIARLRQHRDTSTWFKRIQRIEISRYPTRERAVEAERGAIRRERPQWNLSGNRVRLAREEVRPRVAKRLSKDRARRIEQLIQLLPPDCR